MASLYSLQAHCILYVSFVFSIFWNNMTAYSEYVITEKEVYQ